MHFSMPLNTPPAFAPPYTSKILRYQFDGEIKTWQIIHQIPAIPTDSKAKRNSILGDKDSFPVSWRFKKNKDRKMEIIRRAGKIWLNDSVIVTHNG